MSKKDDKKPLNLHDILLVSELEGKGRVSVDDRQRHQVCAAQQVMTVVAGNGDACVEKKRKERVRAAGKCVSIKLGLGAEWRVSGG
jgi:hypothetical protein